MLGIGISDTILGGFGLGGAGGGSSGFSGRDIIWADLRFPDGVGNNGTDEFPYHTVNAGFGALPDGGTLMFAGGDASGESGISILARSFTVRGLGGLQTSGGLPCVLPTLTYAITSGTQRLAFHEVSVALVANSSASLTQLFFHFCPNVTVTAGTDAPTIFWNGDRTSTFSGSGGTARFRGGTIAGYTANSGGGISIAAATITGNLTSTSSITITGDCLFGAGVSVTCSSIFIDVGSYNFAVSAGVSFSSTPVLLVSFGTPVDTGTANAPGTSNLLAHVDHVHNTPFSAVNNALANANASINVNGQKITNVGAPTSTTDVVNKAYADALGTGLKVKTPAVAVATANQGTLSGTAQTIDGVALNTIGQRVLLIGQTTASQNGLWVVQSGAWTRPTDFATGSGAAQSYVLVTGGTVNAGSAYYDTNTAGSDVVDTNNLTWVLFTQASVVTAGAGLTKTGNTLDVVANADATIVVAADDIKVGVIGNANLANNTIALARLVNAGAQYDFMMRVSSGSGAWEDASLAQAQAALGITVSGALKAVRAATTANITLSGTQTVDGVALVANDRCLVKNQTTGSQNGVYVVAAGAWSRSSDLAASSQIFGGLVVAISEGSTNGNRVAILTTDDTITLGTTALTFAMDRIVPVTSTSPLDVSKSAASTGTSTEAARQDHKHDVTTAAPTGGVTAGGSAAEGTATTLARSDHAHPVSVVAPVDIGTANATGSASTFVRSDHVHNLPFSTVQTVLGGATGAISVNGQKITNVATPTVGTDAANKSYVDAAFNGFVGPANPGDNNKVAYANAGILAYAAGVKTSGTNLTVTATASTGSVATTFSVTDAAHTALTASTERHSALFDFGQTRQWATGALTNERALRVIAPTISFVGASTVTTAATVAISGAPTAGTNATITQNLALWLESGALGVGTALSRQGAIRLAASSGAGGVWFRTNADSADITGLFSGTDDVLYLGDPTNSVGMNLRTKTTTGVFTFFVGASSVATLDATALALAGRNLTFTTGIVSFTTSNAGSTAPAGSGLIRTSGSAGPVISARNYDNTGDITAFGHAGDGSTFSDLYVGEGVSKGFNSLYLRSKTQAILELGTVQEFKFFTTYADFTDNQLRFGTTPAVSGHVNAPNATTIIAAHKASTGDMALLATSPGNEMLLGDTSNVANIYQQFAGSMFLKRGGTTFARFDTTAGLSLFDGVVTYYPVTCSTVTLGASASTTGLVRFPGGTQSFLKRRNNGNSADLTMMGADTSDNLFIGDTTNGGHNVHDVPTGKQHQLRVNSTNVLNVSGTIADFTSLAASFGTNPATVDVIRLPNNNSISIRNAANSGNIRLIGADSSDRVLIGEATNTAGVYAQIKAGGVFEVQINSAAEYDFFDTYFDVKTNHIKVDNSASVPSAPGSGGYIYAEAGAGKWVSSSGTKTTFGPAEPHCPRCHCDFAHEWESKKYGKLSYCSSCLVDALVRAGIAEEEFIIERKKAA